MIKENYIFFDIDAKNKEEALDFISSKAFEYGITDDKEGLLGDFLKREEEYSTGLQDEFAIPHAKSTHAKEVAIFFVKCKNELDWETLDDSKVKYLFALIAVSYTHLDVYKRQPHIDTGDYVIITNADKITVTGKKLEQKIYYRHSDYVGGMKEMTLKEKLDKKPESVIELAVKGMLPKGPLGRAMIKKLFVYAGPEHPRCV